MGTFVTKPKLSDHLPSDDKFFDRQPVGKGSHQLLNRHVQPTEWSRKSSLAGRPVENIRVWELSHRGLSEFSFRLLTKGRHQGIVWTRSTSEAVFLSHLLKGMREVDKQKDASKFMRKMRESIVDDLKKRAPIVDSTASEELARTKAKLAQAGLTLTPTKRSAEDEPENTPIRAKPKAKAKQETWAKPLFFTRCPDVTSVSSGSDRPVHAQRCPCGG